MPNKPKVKQDKARRGTRGGGWEQGGHPLFLAATTADPNGDKPSSSATHMGFRTFLHTFLHTRETR